MQIISNTGLVSKSTTGFVSLELCLLDKAVNFNGNWRRTSAEEHLSDARVLPTHLQRVEEWKKMISCDH